MAVAAADIMGRKSFENWLNERPEATRWQDAAVLAHRSAMRAAPFTRMSVEMPSRLRGALLVNLFWANIVARAAIEYATPAIAESAASASSKVYRTADRVSASEAAYSASYAAHTCANGADFVSDAIETITFATEVGQTDDTPESDFATLRPNQVIVQNSWAMLRSDATAIENDLTIAQLLAMPLWDKAPHWWQQKRILFLKSLRGTLLTSEGFELWAEWYDAVANGSTAFGISSVLLRRSLERTIALGSTEGRFNKDFWKRDPAAINADIKRWVEKARAADRSNSTQSKAPLPPESAVGQPNPSVTQFAQGETGLITAIADPLEPAADRAMQDLRELYEEARDKALAAQSLGRNMLGPCHDPLEQVLTYAPEDFALVRVNRLHAKLSSLRDRVFLHEQQLAKPIEDRDLSLVLQEEVAVRLSACVKQFNLVMAFDKRGRELNSLQHGPEARARAEAINTALRPVVINVGGVGDEAVVNIILGDNNAVKNASRDIHGDQAVVRVAEQNENLAMAVLQVGWRIAREAERQGLAQPTLELVISVAGQHGPKLLEFIQRFDQAFLWLAQHVEAFQILSALIMLLASYRIANKKP